METWLERLSGELETDRAGGCWLCRDGHTDKSWSRRGRQDSGDRDANPGTQSVSARYMGQRWPGVHRRAIEGLKHKPKSL